MNVVDLFPYIKINKEGSIIDFNNDGEQILNKLSLSGVKDVGNFLLNKIKENKKLIAIQNSYYTYKAHCSGNVFSVFFLPLDYLDISVFFDMGLLQHELKNPLTIIDGTIQLMMKKSNDDFVIKCAEVIKRECLRLHEFVQNLRVFSDLNVDFSKNNMNELIKKLIDSMSMLFADINFKVEIDPSVSEFYFDYQKIYVALQNIVKNCCEAQKKGDIVLLIHIDPTIKFQDSVKNKLYPMVKIIIIDSAGGMEPQVLDNIFKPFYTTKNKGMGLGLSIAKEIITAHKGKIEVSSELGKGTVFNIYLPYIA
ncbi:two-component system sensor histidine kinase NtrB [Deferribacter abyssi]|uniref:two-component system sensor histidine kinase NtrB n=1 Tax=Deferribacter abyssi TaxID=213806 RepID=UPI003C186EBB